MAEDVFDSEGSELFLSLDGTTLVAFDCPTGITGLGFSATERESWCLNETISRSRPGKRKLSAFTVPFRVTKGSETHKYLLSLSEEGVANIELPYGIGWSDGTSDPVLTAGEVTPPGTSPNWTRTVTAGSMFVSSVSFDFADGEDVMGSLTAMPQTQKTYWKPVV